MMIDRRITNGLAWAGVLLVVGVPVADLLSAQLMGEDSPAKVAQVSVVDPVAPVPAPAHERPAAPAEAAAPAPVAPAVAEAPARPIAVEPAAPVATPAAKTADAVDAWIKSGKPLPSYITGATQPAQVAATDTVPTEAATAPVAVPSTPAVATVDPVEVAAIPPQKVAPVPMPLSMRPKPVVAAAVPAPAIVVPPELGPAVPPPMVVPGNVTAADLEDWEMGPLAEFLARRQAGNAYVGPGYDTDGFFLDQRPRVIAREVDEDPFFPFFD